MDYELVDLIDIEELKKLTDNWTKLINPPMGIFDPYGNALVGSGWLSICTDFHCANRKTRERCRDTEQEMFNRLKAGKEFSFFKCPNGLVDTGSAIAKLGAKAIGRRELENNEGYELREPQRPYNRIFGSEKCNLRPKNDYIWQVYQEKTGI